MEQQSTQQDRLLTVEGVAELLQLKARTVRKYIREGKIESVKINHRTVRVRQSAVDAFIASLSEGGAS
jgi:excisionase family DNA binding protein